MQREVEEKNIIGEKAWRLSECLDKGSRRTFAWKEEKEEGGRSTAEVQTYANQCMI